jgi:hypothetical protein
VEGVYSHPYGCAGGNRFLTTEVWTTCGLVTYYVLFFIHLASRKIHVAGMAPYPDQRWMAQMACNVTIGRIAGSTSRPGMVFIRMR